MALKNWRQCVEKPAPVPKTAKGRAMRASWERWVLLWLRTLDRPVATHELRRVMGTTRCQRVAIALRDLVAKGLVDVTISDKPAIVFSAIEKGKGS